MNRRKFLATAVALACAPVVAQVTAKIPLAARPLDEKCWIFFADPDWVRELGLTPPSDYLTPIMSGEIGRYQGFRFIESPPPTRLQRFQWALRAPVDKFRDLYQL